MESGCQSAFPTVLNEILQKTKITVTDLQKVTENLNICLLQEVSSDKWELICNSLVCLLYHSLHLNATDDKTNIISVCKIFHQKWFSFDMDQFPVAISAHQRLSCYGAVILLFHHHFPKDSALYHSKEILQMPDGALSVPKSITNSLCLTNQYKKLNVVLLNSLCYLLKVPIQDEHIEDYYHQSFVHFLEACQAYRGGSFDESINILSKIDVSSCSSILGGWVYVMTGINFYHLKNYQVALRNCHVSLNHAPSCIIALYFSAKCFNALKKGPADVECLSLFIAAIEDNNADDTLHGLLLNYHQPLQYMIPQVKLLLILSKIKYGNFEGTKDMLLLVEKAVKPQEQRTLLNPTDLPLGTLPAHAIQFLLLFVSVMETNQITVDLSELPQLEDFNLTRSADDQHNLGALSVFASHALKVDCIRVTNVCEALDLATRLELIHERRKKMEGPVAACFCIIMQHLYRVLKKIHKEKGHGMNASYYNKRLIKFEQCKFDLDPSHDLCNLYLQIIYNYFAKLV